MKKVISVLFILIAQILFGQGIDPKFLDSIPTSKISNFTQIVNSLINASTTVTGATPISHTFTGGESSYDFGVQLTPSAEFQYGTSTDELLGVLQKNVAYTVSGSVITFIGFTPSANDVIWYKPNIAVHTAIDASDTTLDSSGFNGNLSATDTDVQTALNTIDNLVISSSNSNLTASIVITNPILATNFSQQIVASPGANKVIIPTSLRAIAGTLTTVDGVLSLGIEYDANGVSSNSNTIAFSTSGYIWTRPIEFNALYSGNDYANSALNIKITGTDQNVTGTFFVQVEYVIVDLTSGF